MAEDVANMSREERIQLAIACCSKEDGTSARKAAKAYNLTPSTLTRRMRCEVQPASIAHQSRQRLTPAEEQLIVSRAIEHYESGLPLGIRHLRDFANEAVNSRGTNDEEVGKNWHTRLLARNPAIRRLLSRPPARVQKPRVMRKDTLDDFFQLYSDLRQSHAIAFTDIYNMDEKGLLTGAIRQTSVIITMQKRHALLREDADREWASILECISADGVALPAWMIFKAGVRSENGFRQLNSGISSIAVSDKGWSNEELAMHWLQELFHPFTEKRRHSEYRMLIVDGHGPQCRSEFVDFCVKNKIILLLLPPQNARLVQPLDEAAYQPLAKIYGSFVLDHKRFCRAWLEKEELIRYYQLARKDAVTKASIMAGWKKTGLFPFNPTEVAELPPNPVLGPPHTS
jgi:DDE superfamily endonuclease/helix-turn-helix, Psq domain